MKLLSFSAKTLVKFKDFDYTKVPNVLYLQETVQYDEQLIILFHKEMVHQKDKYLVCCI